VAGGGAQGAGGVPSSMAATHSLTLFTKLPARCSMSARRCSRSSLDNHRKRSSQPPACRHTHHAALSASLLPLLSWGADPLSVLRWRSWPAEKASEQRTTTSKPVGLAATSHLTS
jgi:hypothetical protein